MMAAPVYLGDEVSGTGWRLAGAVVHSPAAGEVDAAFAAACAQAPLVLLSASVARSVPALTLQHAMLSLAPLVLVLPDLRGDTPMPDLAARLRAQLGMDA